MARKVVDYKALMKKLPSSVDQKEIKKIVDSITKSRAAGKAKPLKYVPTHIKIMKKADSDCKKICDALKKKKDAKALKEVEKIQKSIGDEIKIFSKLVR